MLIICWVTVINSIHSPKKVLIHYVLTLKRYYFLFNKNDIAIVYYATKCVKCNLTHELHTLIFDAVYINFNQADKKESKGVLSRGTALGGEALNGRWERRPPTIKIKS